MDLFFILKGIILGFSIAAPVGPIGILCIRRTLAYGQMTGFFSGLGAATADTIYGSIAAFGLAFISSFLVDNKLYLQILGGFFLLYLGYTIYNSPPANSSEKTVYDGLLGAYLSTFILTLTNPMTIISFVAVFAALGIGSGTENYLNATLLVIGVFIGSVLWWLLLSFIVNIWRSLFDYQKMLLINRLSGLIIVIFGLISLITAYLP